MKHLGKFIPKAPFLLAALISAGLLLVACSGNAAPASTEATSAPTITAEISSAVENTPNSEASSPSEPAITASRTEDAANASSTPNPTMTPKAIPTRKPASAYADLEIVTLLPPDAIPAINNPVFLSAEEADQFYDPKELVMGVTFNGDSRAYSAPFLSNHEIVNDTVGGVKIAVTW